MLGFAEAAGDRQGGAGDQHRVGGIGPGAARMRDQVGQAIQVVHRGAVSWRDPVRRAGARGS
jgi:hypothetical protein